MTPTHAALPDVTPLSKELEELREELLREVAAQPRHTPERPGLVDFHFAVQMGKPIPELDTALAKAYAVQDDRDPTRALYALVCNPKMPVRGNVVKALLGVSLPDMVTMHAAAVAELPGVAGTRMVLVYDRPQGKSLAAIIAERRSPFAEQFIVEHVVAAVGAAIQQLSDRGISHGRINPSNVFFGTSVMLGECAAEPCGYSQPYEFEPPERAQAMPAGKGESMIAHDIFSLGMLAAFLRLGPAIFEKAPTQEQHILRMLAHGAYSAIATNVDFSDAMTDLLRGTLNDHPHERWTWLQIKPWCKGRRYNMLAPSEPGIAMRPMTVDNMDYSNLRTVSHGLYAHWEFAIRLIQDGSLVRWVDLSLRRKDVAELLRRAMAALGGSGNRSVHQNDELVSRSLTILDPQAPLGRREIRAHVHGIGSLLAEGYRTGATQYIQHALEMIEQGLPVIWADMYKRNDMEPPGNVTNVLWLLDRMRVVLRIPGYGFGMERALYDLCPDLPCQSPLLDDFHAATLKDMLIALDRIAASKAREDMPFDRHIAAFISSKLSLTRESHLSEYNNIPRLARHRAFVALRMLEQAQDSAGGPKTPALTAWITAEALSAVELFHSKAARTQLRMGLKQLALNGFVSPISSFINQRGFAASDLDGFRDAIQSYFETSQEIVKLRNKHEQKRRASISGYSVAKYIAHIGLLIVASMVFQAVWK